MLKGSLEYGRMVYRLAWGYEIVFTIEHDNTLKTRIDCRDCYYYEKGDKSCCKRPLYHPEVDMVPGDIACILI